jgi:hypothetical protein
MATRFDMNSSADGLGTGLGTNDISALFKIKYVKLSENIYNSANVLLGRCKKSYNFTGEKLRIAIPQSFAGGVGSGSLPKAGVAKYGKAEITAKKVYARVEIDRETIKAAKKDEGSFVKATSEVVKKGVESYMRNMSRILFSDGSGALGSGAVNQHTGISATVSIANMKESDFEEGDLVNIFEVDDDASATETLKGLLTAPQQIIDVDPVLGTITLDTSVAAASANSVGSGVQKIKVYLQGSKDKDPQGLKSVVKAKQSPAETIYNIDQDRKWSSVEKDASSASISTDLLNELMLSVEKKCGKAPNMILTSYKQYEKILNILEDQKRYEVKTRAGLKSKSGADISFSGVEFMSTSGPVGIFPERFCDDDRVYALNDNHIHIHHRPDFGWFDDDGTVFLRLANEDAYEARYGGYLEVFINPAFQGLLKNLA